MHAVSLVCFTHSLSRRVAAHLSTTQAFRNKRLARTKKSSPVDELFLEQVTGLEPVISAWKANVFPLHYTCMRLCEVVGGCNKTKSPFINGQKRMSAYEWSGKRGSNPPPQPWQGCALPNELLPQNRSVVWCGRRDLNPYAFRAPEPKSGASANSATPAHRSASAEEKMVIRRRVELRTT